MTLRELYHVQIGAPAQMFSSEDLRDADGDQHKLPALAAQLNAYVLASLLIAAWTTEY